MQSSIWRSYAVARHELRLLRRDPGFVVILSTMPLIVMAFLNQAYGAVLVGTPADGNGADQVVPGITVMFGLFLVSNVGFSFFREYGWKTWDRVRACGATPAEVLVGMIVVPLMESVIQLCVLFGLGGLIFGLHVKGSIAALAVLAAAFSISSVCFGLAILAICNTIMQLNATATLSAVVLAGLGGAIAPSFLLPGWAQAIAPATPSYWAMRGFRNVIIEGAGLRGVGLSVAVLALFSVGFIIVVAIRFRYSDNKRSFA